MFSVGEVPGLCPAGPREARGAAEGVALRQEAGLSTDSRPEQWVERHSSRLKAVSLKPKKKPQGLVAPCVPFMEQLHSHFHHHVHLRNDLPAISEAQR